jgi:peroxiredoxin (alkyl hydroperoxide reductase subunit C)
MVVVRRNAPDPDVVAPTYHQEEFVTVKLSEYLGKWTPLCFHPGDFTFV